jgi:hypothetical protein
MPTAFASATAGWVSVRFRGDTVSTLANYGFRSLLDAPGKDDLEVLLHKADADVFLVLSSPGNGGAFLLVGATSAFVAGEWYVALCGVAGSTAVARVMQHDGSDAGVPLTVEKTAGWGAFFAGTGSYTIGSPGCVVDGVALHTSKPSYATICNPPGATNRIAYYTFESSPATDADGGASLTLSNVTLSSGGLWDLTAPPPLFGAARHARLRTTRGRGRRAPLSLVPVSRAPLPLSTVEIASWNPTERLRPTWAPAETLRT